MQPAVGKRPSPRVGKGRVELVPEGGAAGFDRLRANLADRPCRLLLTAVLVAQLADAVTTYIALHSRGYSEVNPIFQPLLAASPWLANVVKLAAISAVLLLVVFRLPVHRARRAVLLAACLSLIAPVLNLHVLL
jgi:uncharacterized membrane protein